MTLSMKAGTFAKSTTTAPAAFNQAITGVGFQPKAVLFWLVGTNLERTFEHATAFGFSDGTNDRSIAWSAEDGKNTSNTARRNSNTAVISHITPTGNVDVDFDIVSFDADGFTIRYNVNNTTAMNVCYVALGGTDITGVKAGTFNAATSTGDQDVTGVGFSPDMVFFAGTNNAINTTSSHSVASIGFAKSMSQHGVNAWGAEDGNSTADASRFTRTNRCIALFKASDVSVMDGEAEYVGQISDGFRVDWTNAPGTAHPIFYLAIKGGLWNVKGIVSPTSNISQEVTGVGFQPAGIIMQSMVNAVTSTITSHDRMAIGAATSSSERWSIWGGNRDGASPTITARGISTTTAIRLIEEASTGSSSTIKASANYVSNDADGFTLGWSVTSGTAYRIMCVLVGASSSVSTVTKAQIHKYHVQTSIPKTVTNIYNMGGTVSADIMVQKYNVLGKVTVDSIHRYGIQNPLSIPQTHKYNIALSTFLTTAPMRMMYDMSAMVRAVGIHEYTIIEHPSTNSAGYGKPLRPRIYFMSNNGGETYHVYDSFEPAMSPITVNSADVSLDSAGAGEFTITVEDSSGVIDPTIVGEGNLILIQAAKTQVQLGDGEHDLLLGYIKNKTVQRPDTDVLQYEFSGFGTQIKFNERITNFSYAARRTAYNSALPDRNDTSMYAVNLVKKLMESSDHLPIGTPLETQFTMKGVTEREPTVDDFIPAIETELVPFADIMNRIAQSTGAQWGVDAHNDIFLRFPTLEHSKITLKDKIEVGDDRRTTAYIVGPWSYEDSIKKEDGFTNRFFAKTGSKEVISNTTSLADIATQFTPLVINQAPSSAPPSTPAAAGIGMIIPLYISPTNAAWETVANIARQYPTSVRIIAIVSPSNGPGTAQSIDYVNGINTLQSAGITVLGYIDTVNGTRTTAAVDADTDTYVTWYEVDGVFFDNTDTVTDVYLDTIADYAKITKLLTFVAANPGAVPAETHFSNTSVDCHIIYEAANLPELTTLEQEWFSDYPRGSRGVLPHSVNVPADTVRDFINDSITDSVAGYIYVTDDIPSAPWDTLSTFINVIAEELDRQWNIVSQVSSVTGSIINLPSGPAFRDLTQSFTPTSNRLTDLVLILSKIGNPHYEDSGATMSGTEPTIIMPNAVHGHIETNTIIQVVTIDPQTNEETVRLVNMPSGVAVGYFNFPFSDINTAPTVCYLNNIIYDPDQILPGSRYWVVLFGRGQNEENTIRWHHSDNPEFEMLSAERIPGGHASGQRWTVFSNVSGPAFALSYFETTTNFVEASDSDSMERFGLVESTVDLSDIGEEEMIIRVLQAMLQYSAKPKRLYDIRAVTAPDKLILPGKLINIIDTKSNLKSGGNVVEAEIVAVRYNFDANRDGLGARQIEVTPIGYVDFAYDRWKRAFERGEITVVVPSPAFSPPPPLPELPPVVIPPPIPIVDLTPPIVYAEPRGGRFNTTASVRLRTSEPSSIFYTLDGTTPTVNSARYTDGTYLSISSSKPIKFFGVDTAGNVGLTVTENYVITTAQTGGKKHLLANIIHSIDLVNQSDAWKVGMDRLIDYAKLTAAPTRVINSTEFGIINGLPAKLQEYAFDHFASMDQNLTLCKTNGADILAYNIAPAPITPSAEYAAYVVSCKTFADKVHLNGLKFRWAPTKNDVLPKASAVAPFSDYALIPMQSLQSNLATFESDLKNITAAMRAANANIIITVQMSRGLGATAPVSPATWVDIWKAAWEVGKKYVDGVSLTIEDTAPAIADVQTFVTWFNSNGRVILPPVAQPAQPAPSIDGEPTVLPTSTGGGSTGNDVNGVAYVQPLLSDGYRIEWFNETWSYNANFRSDGRRFDFNGRKDSNCVLGYFFIPSSFSSDEVSAKMNGGPHTDSAPEQADTMDMGITNFAGTASRVRWEKTHPSYTSSIRPNSFSIGSCLGKWRGYLGMKVNLPTSNPTRFALIGMVDTGGLVNSTTPANQWVVVYKEIFTPAEADSYGSGLKSYFSPYSNNPQNTIRIDNSPPTGLLDKYVKCSELRVTTV